MQADFSANEDFLGLWMIDICWEGCSQRPTPQNRHTAHLRRHTCCTPRKPSGRNREGGKPQPPTGGESTRQAPGHLSCSGLGRTQHQVQPSLRLCGVPENVNLSGLDLRSACKPESPSDSSRQSNLESEQCRLGKHTRCERGANPVWLNHCEHTPVIFVHSVPPSPTHD